MKTDSQIQADVMQALKWEPSVTHEYIGVAVSGGVVTLSGTVPSFMEKLSAERRAQRVNGVKAVVERIEVKLPGSFKRDDQDIARAILNQFKWNIQVPDEAIKTSVENGWVELRGEVEWDFQRAAAEKCVHGLSGVKGVSNNITIREKKIEPESIRERIEEALKREAEREADHIKVEVQGSHVILSGSVHSLREMQDARGAAFSAPGVTSVENNLRIQ